MNNKLFTLLLAGSMGMMSQINAQNSNATFTVPVKNGSVFTNLSEKHLDRAYISQNLVQLLGLSNKHSFTKATETGDQLGFTHIGYQQYFQGILVDNGLILVHYKNGIANSINGNIAQISTLNTQASITGKLAYSKAKEALEITKVIKEYPSKLVIASVGTKKLPQFALAYKVRVDGKTTKGKVVMMNVYIDASTGKALKKINLIASADVNATAHTMYSGTQTIVTDNAIPGTYILKDNARKIITLDATGADMDSLGTGPDFFLNAKNVTNSTTSWIESNALTSITLNTASNDLAFYLDPSLGGILSSIVLKDTSNSLANVKYQSWPDIRFDVASTADLPITSKNLFIFPNGDTTLIGSFGILDFSSQSESLLYPGYFGIKNLTAGSHVWSDGQGNTGSYTIASAKNPALDAHWGMERTHDFYKQTFNRNSYDGNGSTLTNYVNGVWPTLGYQNNAAALPYPYFSMVYGLGDGDQMNPLVALDVMGHEFTHMVTETNGNGGLDYTDESGALNESFSDIMGTSIEFFAKGNNANWLIGEDCVTAAGGGDFRSMSNPKTASSPQPDTYLGEFWDTSDPHYNSGVQNKWFYLLSAGDTGTNDNHDSYHVYGIGIDKAEQIAYRNLTQYLTPSATYMDAYAGSIQAAKDLYGDTSDAYHSVRNAWYAVGIGDADTTAPAPPPVITAINQTNIYAQHLQLFPNPASGKVTITSDLDKKITATIVNAVGVKVLSLTINKGANDINIHPLSKGIYFIKYDTGNDLGYVQKLSIY
jgi:Zn-dependent metalloprotease